MSDLVDTNIFIYAVDEDSNYHQKAKEFIDRCINDDQTWFFTWVNIFEFLRVVTHPNIFNNPMKSDDAEKNISFFLSLPQTEILLEERNFFEVYRQLITETGEVSGNLVHDAHIAALMRQHGVKKIYTLDIQFKVFPSLEIINPLK